MTVPRLGEGAYVGLGLVTGYTTTGTSSDIEIWAPLVSGADSVQLERPDIVLEDLFSRSDYTEDFYQGGNRMVSGTMTLEVNLSIVPDLLRAFTGDNATPSGADPYTYAFQPVARGDASHYFLGTTERALVLEVFRGGSYANSTFYSGVFITELQFVFEKNDFARVTISFIGRSASISAKSTPVMTTLDKLLVTPTGQGATTLTFGGADTTVHSATVTMRNGLATRHDLTGVDSILPVPEGKESSELQIDIETEDDTFVTLQIGGKVRIGTTNQLSIEPASGTNKLTFLFRELLMVGPGEPRPSGPGPVRWNGTLRAVSNSPTNVGIDTITVINNQASYLLT